MEEQTNPFTCPQCKNKTSTPYSLCEHCKHMISIGSTYTPIKNRAGKIKLDYNNRSICKLCGFSYENIYIHLGMAHKLSMEEYLKMFGCEDQAKEVFDNSIYSKFKGKSSLSKSRIKSISKKAMSTKVQKRALDILGNFEVRKK